MKENGELGKCLRVKRLAAGISLSGLAKTLGITKQAIGSVETGQTKCIGKSKGVMKLCDYFEIDIEEFRESQPKRKLRNIKSKTHLGKLLVKRRMQLCLSRKDLCNMISLSSYNLYLLERGNTKKLNPDLLKALEKFLGREIPEKYFSTSRKYSREVKRPSSIGALIFKLREEQGLTQFEVAKKSKTSLSTIVRIENKGTVRPRCYTIFKILRALNAELPKGTILRR